VETLSSPVASARPHGRNTARFIHRSAADSSRSRHRRYSLRKFFLALVGIIGIMGTFVIQNSTITPDKFLALSGVIVSYIIGRSWAKASAARQPDASVANQTLNVKNP